MNMLAMIAATMGDDPLTEHQRAIGFLEEILPLERYAEVCAALLHYPPQEHAEVLVRMRADAARWTEIDARWIDALQCKGYSIDEVLALRFVRAFMRERKDLRDKNPKVRKLGPLPAVAPPVPEQGAPSTAPASTPAVETPTFMKPGVEPKPGPGQIEGAAAAAPLVPKPALVPPPSPLPAGRLGRETAAVDVSKLVKPSVPFDPSNPSAMAPPGPAPSPTTGGRFTSETTELNLRDLLKARPAVPFAPAPGSPHTVDLSPADAGKAHGRLLRFDPQTGAPLATPRWEDLPESPAAHRRSGEKSGDDD